ncbi:MAG: SIMPL domain-containing protein [Fusobacteriaceae bacterium]|nr:SIMPL domain-containing protein [Fusobacteriaceae bacterium]
MKKILLSCVMILGSAYALAEEKILNLNLEAQSYTAEQVQLLKLQYERESLQYGGQYIRIGALDNMTGSGTVQMKPEFFYLTFELKTSASKFSVGSDNKAAKLKATEENTKVMTEFKDFLIKAAGVKEEDMETLQYGVVTNSGAVKDSADVVHQLKVKFDIRAGIGEVYKKIEPTDIKVLGEPLYGVSEKTRKASKLLAYDIAMKDALAQAEAIAKAGRFEIGDVRYVQENTARPLQYRQSQANVSFAVADAAMDRAIETEAPVPISVAQEMKVQMALVVSFDMVKKVK